jgi:ubiquitin-like protein Pup
MSTQGEQRRVARQDHTDSVETDPGMSTASRDRLDADVDAILDEIDEVLEENAEEFVKSFVQKGGQ